MKRKVNNPTTAVDTSRTEDYFLSRTPTPDEEERARALLATSVVVDTCGAIRPTGPGGALDDSIGELKNANVDCIGLTLAAEEDDIRSAMNMILKWNGLIRRYSRDLVHVTTADEIRQAREDGRIAVYYLFQNGRPFEDDAGNVELFRQMGVTSSQLTYNRRNFLGDGCAEADDGGLSHLGREVVAEMNRVGMLIDLSHAGERTQQEIALASARPVHFSHSNAAALYPTRRNTSDRTLEIVAERGGLMSVTTLGLTGEEHPTVADMGGHIEYTLAKLGPKGVGLAMDYPKGRPLIYEHAHLDDDGYLNIQHDGTMKVRRSKWEGPGCLPHFPWYQYAEGITSYTEFPNIVREMVVRGLGDDVIKGVLGESFLALYRRVVG